MRRAPRLGPWLGPWLGTLLLAACSPTAVDDGPGAGGDSDPDGDHDTLDPLDPLPDASDALFDDTRLHHVDIVVAAGELDTLDNDTSSRVPCRIEIDGQVVENAGIRKKGQTSMRPLSDKPSFSVKLNEFVAGQKIFGLKKLLLHNSVMDASLLNEHVGAELYRAAGLPTPRSAYALLTFNGEPKGIYLLREAINAQFMERWYGDGNDQGNLYEGPWDFGAGVAAAELKDEVEEGRSKDDLQALSGVVLATVDGAWEAGVAAHLDLSELITSMAVDGVYNNYDGYNWCAWNFYLYHHPGDDRFRMVPMGYDWPFPLSDSDPHDLWNYPWGQQFPPGELAARITQVPGLDAQVRAEIERVGGVVWDQADLLGVSERAEAVLSAIIPTDGRTQDDQDEFLARLDAYRAWLADRRAFLAP